MGPQNIAYPGAPKQMGQNAFQPQQYFPMPQGNVYTIEQPEEVNSVPCGTGVSVAFVAPNAVSGTITHANVSIIRL